MITQEEEYLACLRRTSRALVEIAEVLYCARLKTITAFDAINDIDMTISARDREIKTERDKTMTEYVDPLLEQIKELRG